MGIEKISQSMSKMAFESSEKQMDLMQAIESNDIKKVEALTDLGNIDPMSPLFLPSRSRLISPLELATLNNEPKVVKALLKSARLNLLTPDQHQLTVIHRAILNSGAEVVGLLVAHFGVSLEYLPRSVFPLLHFALLHGRESAALQIVRVPSLDINRTDHQGNTALHYLAQFGSLPVLEVLLKKPSLDLQLRNLQGLTALDYVMIFRRHAIAERMLQAPLLTFDYDMSKKLLSWSIEENQLGCVNRIVRRYPTILNSYNDVYSSPLAVAIALDRPKIVNYLIQQPGLDTQQILEGGWQALDVAVATDNVYALKCLLSLKQTISRIPKIYFQHIFLTPVLTGVVIEGNVQEIEAKRCQDLFNSYTSNPVKARELFRKELFLDPASQVLSLMVARGDGYLQDGQSTGRIEGKETPEILAKRYFTIAGELPHELQHRLALLTYGMNRDFIPASAQREGLDWFMETEGIESNR
jgi:ankyrin repeat protein